MRVKREEIKVEEGGKDMWKEERSKGRNNKKVKEEEE